jgi:hypothetical protein
MHYSNTIVILQITVAAIAQQVFFGRFAATKAYCGALPAAKRLLPPFLMVANKVLRIINLNCTEDEIGLIVKPFVYCAAIIWEAYYA